MDGKKAFVEVALVLSLAGALLLGAVSCVPERGGAGGEDVAAAARRQLAVARAELATARDRISALRKTLAEQRAASQPCDDRFVAHLTLFPSSGPVGTRVRFWGDCLVDSLYDSEREIRGGFGVFLTRQLDGCDQVVAGEPFDLSVSGRRISGYFSVASAGSCSARRARRPVTPGRYSVGLGCAACSTNATFRVSR